MPVAQGSRPPARQAVLIGLGALLGLLAVAFLITRFDRLNASDSAEIELGDPLFQLGDATEFAPLIAEQGPLFLPDAARGDRDLYLQHLGPGDSEGWLAFSARLPDTPRDCFVEWQADDRTFVDNCDGTVYPDNGEGLTRYAVSVSPEGALTINLNPLG